MTRSPIIKGYADSRDGQIHYRMLAGADHARPLLFLHQTASSGAMFERVMRRLQGERTTIAFDTPGFGGSFVPDGTPDLVYYAERLLEAIDGLGIGDFDLCGHHTGGCIALEIAALAPERLKSLCLIGPVIASPEERDRYRQTFLAPFSVKADGSHLKTAWDYLASIGANGTLDLHHREMIDHLIGAHAMPKAFGAVWEQDSEARLRAISAPLLLMISRDDVLWSIFANATCLRPDAAIAIVAGMDFQPDRDPDGVAEGLSHWLASLDG